MEAAGRDGGRGSTWSYRRRLEETESSCFTISSSSRSGTIVSTTHTSGASRLSSMDAALELDLELELRLGTPDKKDAEFAQPIKKPRKATEETLKEKRMKDIESLVQEFFRGPTENRSILGGMSALERWLLELDVSWVLQLYVGASVPATNQCRVGIWIQALTQIMETIHLTESLFPDRGLNEEEVDSGEQPTNLDPVQFTLFIQEAMSKMLVFVDAMSTNCSIHEPEHSSFYFVVDFLDLHRALSEVSSRMRFQFHCPSIAMVEKIEKEMVSLLSAKQSKVFDGIYSALEKTRTHVHKLMEEYSSGTQILQFYYPTVAVMGYIKKLRHQQVTRLLSQAASLGEAPPYISFITEMVSCLEEKLITRSQFCLDKGLGLLFLLINSNYIQEELQHTLSYIKVDAEIVTHKDELGHYIESYIQVSWASMLSCLIDPTPLCLVRKYSPLSRFESEFQKTYTTQKLWKVPDPELRKWLRKAVIKKIIPGYTKYIDDNKVINPKFTPQELEEMLQELFEG